MTYADALAVATQDIQREIPDTLAKVNYLYSLMIKRLQKKGASTYIQMPISFADIESNGYINGSTSTISNNVNQTLTQATLEWKYFYSNFSITLQDRTMTGDDKNSILSLVKAKKAGAKNSSIRKLSQTFFQSGTAGNLQVNGMADIFAAAGTAYGGISDTTYPSWLPYYDSTSSVVNYANISNMLAILSERINQSPFDTILEEAYEVDTFISRAQVMNAYKQTLIPAQRFASENIVKSGFKGIEVDGIFWQSDFFSPGSVDGTTADNYLYLLSSKSFHLFSRFGFGDSGASPMDTAQILPNQPIDMNVQYMVGNLGCSNRRVNGAFKTLVV